MMEPLYDDRIDDTTAATLLDDLGSDRDSQRYAALSEDERLDHQLTIEDGDPLRYRVAVEPLELEAARGWKSGISYLLSEAMDRLSETDPYVFEGTIPANYDLEELLGEDETQAERRGER